jgi:hypothetical protein
MFVDILQAQASAVWSESVSPFPIPVVSVVLPFRQALYPEIH